MAMAVPSITPTGHHSPSLSLQQQLLNQQCSSLFSTKLVVSTLCVLSAERSWETLSNHALAAVGGVAVGDGDGSCCCCC